GGTPTYTYNFIVFNSISNTILANQLGSSNSFTFTTNSQWIANSPIKANVLVTDSAAGAGQTANSVLSSAITVNSALAVPTITPSSPIGLDSGQSNTIFTYETGGTPTYTYNFIVFNSISNTILANQLGSSNSFTFTTNSQWIANSPIKANVLVTDSAAGSGQKAN